MSRPCTICSHSKVDEINAAILRNDASRRTASIHGTTEAAIRRHKAHLPAQLVEAKSAAKMASADTLLGQVRLAEGRAERLYAAAEQILQRALSGDEPRTALSAIKAAVDVMGEARQYLELRGDLTGELNPDRKGPGSGGATVTINFPTLSADDLKAVESAQVIDLSPTGRRLLTRPSDGKPR